jgi:hypothetical protein
MAECCGTGTFTITWDNTPLEDRIAVLKANLASCDRRAKELRDNLASMEAEKAKQAAEKAKTYGQRVAEQLVVPYAKEGGPGIHFKREPGVGGHAFACESGRFSDPPQKQIENVRKFYAAALDKAHADGKAEQRESDAGLCRVHGYGFIATRVEKNK